MARIGRPVLLRCRSTIENVGRQLRLYRDTMSAAGFDEPAVEKALDLTWVWADSYVAESDEEALDEFVSAYHRGHHFINDARERWNPKARRGPGGADGWASPSRDAYGAAPDPGANELLAGSPKRVAEQIGML